MPDWLDKEQDMQLMEGEALHERVRQKAQRDRMREPSSGWCSMCGDPIDPRRLEVVPSASECVPCLSNVEFLTRVGNRPRG